MNSFGKLHRIALVGANGMLAQAVKRHMPANCEILSYDLPEFDMTQREIVLQHLLAVRPDVIINCAAFTNVDGAESSKDTAFLINGKGPAYLAEATIKIGAILVHISTDYVFDGTKSTPYVEMDAVNPQSAYGHSKLAGEDAVRQSGLDRYFIIRTSWLYGRGGKNFVETILRLASEREELRIVADQVGSPTLTDDLAVAIYRLLGFDPIHKGCRAPFGLYHFSNEGKCSWFEFAREIVRQSGDLGVDILARTILPIATEEYPLPAKRPGYSVFSKQKYCQKTGAAIPHWSESLSHYLRERFSN